MENFVVSPNDSLVFEETHNDTQYLADDMYSMNSKDNKNASEEAKLCEVGQDRTLCRKAYDKEETNDKSESFISMRDENTIICEDEELKVIDAEHVEIKRSDHDEKERKSNFCTVIYVSDCRQAMACENQGSISTTTPLLTKKLCVEANKDFNSLISQQGNPKDLERSNRHELLPEKSDVAAEDLVTQLGGHIQEKVSKFQSKGSFILTDITDNFLEDPKGSYANLNENLCDGKEKNHVENQSGNTVIYFRDKKSEKSDVAAQDLVTQLGGHIQEKDSKFQSKGSFILADITNNFLEDPKDSYVNLNENLCDGKEKNHVENQSGNTVIYFRDINKKVTFDSDGLRTDENVSENLFKSADATRNQRKRRYVKLMQKLEDTEKSLDDHLKGVMDCENISFDKGDATTCIEKVKKKLCIRAKKKYESLINYQRSQANVEQKSFEDLLPEKAEAVTANIVKQLGGEKQEPKVPKKRGRPCKKDVPPESNKEVKEKKSGGKEKCEKPKKTKAEKAMRGFPRKFPSNLLRDSETDFKFDKIRLGIMYKNGTKEVIELSDDTLKGIEKQNKEKKPSAENVSSNDENTRPGLCDSSLHVRNTTEETTAETNEASECTTTLRTEDGKSKNFQANKKVDVTGASENLKQASPPAPTPPTTIQLPSVSSLESDYRLVSVSFLQDGKFGDFKRDHFFIPQATFNKGGQTGMLIVGPFSVRYDPKPHIVLMSPKDHNRDLPMMILTKKSDFSPSGGEGNNGSDILNNDHNYCSPLNMQESVKRFVKGIAKHSASAKFIDARVESIQEGDGNSLVTISGDNILKKVKHIRQHPTAIPISSTKDGIPVIYNLTQIMTSVLKRAEMRAKRDEMAEKSKESGDFTPVFVPYENMGEVAMEVMIPPCGTEIIPRFRGGKCQRSPGKFQTFDVEESSQGQRSFTSIDNVSAVADGTLELMSKSHGKMDWGDDRRWNIVVSDSLGGSCLFYQSYSDQDVVPIENASDVDSTSAPGLACCRMCLRLFPNSYSLFTHVRSAHTSENYSIDSWPYLKELRAKSKVSCPICGPTISYCTSLKMKKHLQTFHSGDTSYKEAAPPCDQVFSSTCSFCLMEFPNPGDLSVHTQMAHGIDGSNMINQVPNVTQRQSGKSNVDGGNSCFFRTDRSLLSDCLTCSRCNIIFDDRNSLISHTLNIHPDLNQSNIICHLCEREFETDSMLLKHLKNSHKQTQSSAMRCLDCPAWLPSVDEVSVHKINVHSGDVPVHCPFCGAGYQSMHSMYNHVRNQHLQTETLMCPECQTTFPSARLLSEHARKQHFLSLKTIKEHMKSVRSGSYCCPFCTVSFTRTYDLAMHVVQQHKDPLLPAKCHFCLQSFVNQIILKMHMAGAHGFLLDQSHPSDRDSEITFLHNRCLGEGEEDAVVLDAEDDDEEDEEEEEYPIPAGFSMQNKNVISSRLPLLMDPRDMMTPQVSDMNGYLQSFVGNEQRETIVYIDDRDQVINLQDVGPGINVGGDMYDAVSTLEQVHLLDDTSDGYNLQGVDYLETLSNDHVAVAADVVADVCMEDIVNSSDERQESGRHVIQTTEDMLGQSLEVDGVLYQLAMAPEGDSRPLNLPSEDVGHQITMTTGDLTHLL